MTQLKTVLLSISFLWFVSACSNNNSDSQTVEKETIYSKSLTVHKSPTCGCCGAWVDHINNAGFSADIIEDSNIKEMKQRFGIIPQAQSCHTAIYDDQYVFEGHVPPATIKAFLNSPPAEAKGLVVPGMPIESAGMEDGDRFQPFQVLQLNNDDSYSVYANIESYEQQF